MMMFAQPTSVFRKSQRFKAYESLSFFVRSQMYWTDCTLSAVAKIDISRDIVSNNVA